MGLPCGLLNNPRWFKYSDGRGWWRLLDSDCAERFNFTLSVRVVDAKRPGTC